MFPRAFSRCDAALGPPTVVGASSAGTTDSVPGGAELVHPPVVSSNTAPTATSARRHCSRVMAFRRSIVASVSSGRAGHPPLRRRPHRLNRGRDLHVLRCDELDDAQTARLFSAV